MVLDLKEKHLMKNKDQIYDPFYFEKKNKVFLKKDLIYFKIYIIIYM